MCFVCVPDVWSVPVLSMCACVNMYSIVCLCV